MKRLVFIFGLILVMVILYQSSGLMAQDPNDPGEPDTLYFTPGGMRSPTGDTLYIWPDSFPQDVIIYINAWNDYNVDALTIVLIDSCNGPPSNANLDESKNDSDGPSKCFEGSRVEHFDGQGFLCSIYPPTIFLSALAMYVEPMPPGNGLLATVIFTVSDTGRICLDTSFIPPANNTKFALAQISHVPVFKKMTFVVSNCAYSCGDPNYDGKTDIVDVVYLINYIFRSGPPPCFEKSGDVTCGDDVNIIDVVYLVSYLFRDGSAPGYCP